LNNTLVTPGVLFVRGGADLQFPQRGAAGNHLADPGATLASGEKTGPAAAGKPGGKRGPLVFRGMPVCRQRACKREQNVFLGLGSVGDLGAVAAAFSTVWTGGMGGGSRGGHWPGVCRAAWPHAIATRPGELQSPMVL